MPDNTVITYYITPGGGTSSHNGGFEKIVTNKPDGTQIVENKDGSWHITFPKKPDGSVKTCYDNGTSICVKADGTSTVCGQQ